MRGDNRRTAPNGNICKSDGSEWVKGAAMIYESGRIN